MPSVPWQLRNSVICKKKFGTQRLKLMVSGTSGDWYQGWEACSGVLGIVQGAVGTFSTAREILPGAAETLRELGTMLPVSLPPLL
jgi:hypothetical protein